VTACATMFLMYQLNFQLGQRTLLIQATRGRPLLTLAKEKRYHGYISHNWANQDLAATIKRQLQLLLSGSKVFLE